MLTRRQLLQGGGAALALAGAGRAAEPASAPQLALWILRGGLDGLAMVPPVGDPHYEAARGSLALDPAACLPLAEPFALHPALQEVHALFGRGEALVVHATATPYRARSHFDAQKVLESGRDRPATSDGWLNRALALVPGARAVALGQTILPVLRGAQPVNAWAPARTPPAAPALMERILTLYAADPLLGPPVAGALALREEAAMGRLPPERDGPGAELEGLAPIAGRLAAEAGGPGLYALAAVGWDTHARQGAAAGPLAARLARLDAAVAAFREACGPAWTRTVLLVATEFGRTVAPNGTGGTDHGTAGALLVLGGAVAGGRVLGDWPGLAPRARLDGRDLRPTLDSRAVFAGALHEHLGIDRRSLAASVLPGAPLLAGLLA